MEKTSNTGNTAGFLSFSDMIVDLLKTMQNTARFEAIKSIIEAELQELKMLELRT